MTTEAQKRALKAVQPDFSALLRDLRAVKGSLTPASYSALKAILLAQAAYRTASQRRQKAYRKRKKFTE